MDLEYSKTGYPYNGLPFSNLKEQITDACGNTMNLKTIMLSEKSLLKNTTYFIILFIWNIQNRHSYRVRNHISSCLKLEVELGIDCRKSQGSFLCWKYSKSGLQFWLYNSINLFNWKLLTCTLKMSEFGCEFLYKTLPKNKRRGTWVAQLVNCLTLDIR